MGVERHAELNARLEGLYGGRGMIFSYNWGVSWYTVLCGKSLR
jgi:hypothetical protein